MASTSRTPIRRRQLRKGTFSCWECKRRKTRCDFNQSSRVCAFCQRRGIPCIGQDIPDSVEYGDASTEQRLARVESLVGQLIQEQGIRYPFHTNAPAVPNDSEATIETAAWRVMRLGELSPHRSSSIPRGLETGLQSMSTQLHANLPHPAKAAQIFTSAKFSTLLLRLQRSGVSPSACLEHLLPALKMPSPIANPLHLANTFIQLALCLHQMDSDASSQLGLQLKESVGEVAQRYIDIASQQVTSRDLLVESPDGIEVLVLEACYHINIGELRSAWLIFRRAIAIAELIDLRTERVWFELITGDHYLSLLLGLPCVATEHRLIDRSQQGETSNIRLERLRTEFLRRIIARNIRMQWSRRHKSDAHNRELDTYDDYQVTEEIDYELKQLGRNLPSFWWSIPSLNDLTTPSDAMENTARLCSQLDYYLLLIALHQPYVIQQALTQLQPDPVPITWSAFDIAYCQAAVVAASREVLYRYLIMRRFHRSLCYRAMDDKGFNACTMLLLIHISAHRLGQANVLEHQRMNDLDLVNQVLCTTHEISRPDMHTPNGSNVQVLRRLLEIEAAAANGITYRIWMEDFSPESRRVGLEADEDALTLPVPFFGTIRFTRQEVANSGPSIELDSESVFFADPAPSTSMLTDAYDSARYGSLTGAPGTTGLGAGQTTTEYEGVSNELSQHLWQTHTYHIDEPFESDWLLNNQGLVNPQLEDSRTVWSPNGAPAEELT